MAELKTKVNTGSVKAFVESVEDPQRKKDAQVLSKLMRQRTRKQPKMWGDAIVGFGSFHYKYASGREGDWFIVGFSPRKQAMSLYLMAGFQRFEPLMKKLGKYKTGKSCLYVKKLDDIDLDVLTELIDQAFAYVTEHQSGGDWHC